MIDRENYLASTKVLNGHKAVAAMQQLQAWLKNGYVDANVDDSSFTSGRVALSWVGHWEYPRYVRAIGKDLVLLPLPDFGQGSRAAQGSWCWSMPASAPSTQAAVAKFLQFLLQPDEVLRMAAANGAVPATQAAIAKSQHYGPAGPLRLFVDQLTQGYTVSRPRTPAYPVISSAFQQAVRDIRDGTDVQEALDKAAYVIDQDIIDNAGYQ